MPRGQADRPALRFFASKARCALWVVSNFTRHTTYVEEFGYGGSLLLAKRPARFEVFNNVNDDVGNFFSVLRDRRDELVAALRMTPYARNEFRAAWLPADEPLERARRLYVRSWQGHSAAATMAASPTAWRCPRPARGTSAGAVEEWNHLDHLLLLAERLKRVAVECDDWEAVFQRYDSTDTLHFIDPPCVRLARGRSWGSGSTVRALDRREHERIAEVARAARGKVVVSGHPRALYEALYGDWQTVSTSVGGRRGGTETLWLSPAAATDIEPLLPFAEQGLQSLHAGVPLAAAQCA